MTAADCRLVARDNAGDIVGWTVLRPVSVRKAYAGVGEAGVYVGAAHRNRGVGSALPARLIRVSGGKGYRTLQGVAFPENKGSIALQQKHGFLPCRPA
jgi:L-amino acid N-acyltransferase YncA